MRFALVLAVALSAVPACLSPAGAQEAGATAEDLIQNIQRLDALERLDATRAALEEDPAAALPEHALSPDEVAQRIADELGAEVLDVRPVDLDGRQAYAVRAMNPPGNYNDAFMVSVVLVDPVTGGILGQAPASAGPAHSLTVGPAGLGIEGTEIRRRTHR